MQEQITRFTDTEHSRKERGFNMKKIMALIFTIISGISMLGVIAGYILDALGVCGAGFYLIGIGEVVCVASASVVVTIGIFSYLE